MLTCSKIYSDIPFAHRQHSHEGHCSFIHGHNWTVKIVFQAKRLDKNKFIIDFGKLKSLKNWIEKNLDHACVLNEEDPFLNKLPKGIFKLLVVKDCSCEGLAMFLHDIFSKIINEQEGKRVRIKSIEILEDSKNSAKYESI